MRLRLWSVLPSSHVPRRLSTASFPACHYHHNPHRIKKFSNSISTAIRVPVPCQPGGDGEGRCPLALECAQPCGRHNTFLRTASGTHAGRRSTFTKLQTQPNVITYGFSPCLPSNAPRRDPHLPSHILCQPAALPKTNAGWIYLFSPIVRALTPTLRLLLLLCFLFASQRIQRHAYI